MRCNASSAIGDFVASNTSNSLRLAWAQQATWMTCGGWLPRGRARAS
jgi:hypothetical protein